MLCYSARVRSKRVTPLLVLVALVAVIYGGYRVVRHVLFPQRAPAIVGSARCAGPVLPVPTGRPLVAFGDSITLGYGATERCQTFQVRAVVPVSTHLPHTGDTTYPANLSRLVGRTVLDYGVGRETTRDGLPRLRSVLAVIHPRVVVLLEGVNDIQVHATPAAVLQRVTMMVGVVRASGARLILLTLTPTAGRYRWLLPAVRRTDAMLRFWSRQHGVQLVDLGMVFPMRDLSRDGLHPNDAGYQWIARQVAVELQAGLPAVRDL